MKNNYILFIWLVSVLTSIQNFGQFCVGTIATLGVIHFKKDSNKRSPAWLSNELILACCLGISSAIFYTWIRFDPAQNVNIMFTKRYLLIPINLISLSMLLSSQNPRKSNDTQKQQMLWTDIATIASINMTLTLPFARAILASQATIIYFCMVIASAASAALLIRDSEKEYRKAWGMIFSISALVLIFFCESKTIGGITMTTLALLILYKLQNTNIILKAPKKILVVIQSMGIYIFSIVFPLLVVLSPWVTPKESNWVSRALWTLTGSRYFTAWSYNIWSSDGLDLRSIFNLKEQIPFLDTYSFYDKNLTKFYGSPLGSIERVRSFLGHAHSDPIQRLLDITTGTSQVILLSIASLLIIIYLWWTMLVAFDNYTSKQEEESFKIFCLISNLAIIAYITTESLTPWNSILIVSSQALCLQRFYCKTEFSNIEDIKPINRSTHCNSAANPRHPLMLLYPYLILLVVPTMILITKSS